MTGLLLIDIQNDYFKDGCHPIEDSLEVAKNTARLLSHFRRNHLPIFHVQHISTAESPFFCPDTKGADFYSLTAPLAGEAVFIKHTPDSFFETGLADALAQAGVTKLVVMGMMTQMCIDTTVRAARCHGLKILLPQDGCAADELIWQGQRISPKEVQRSFLAALSGSFAEIITTDECLGFLQKK